MIHAIDRKITRLQYALIGMESGQIKEQKISLDEERNSEDPPDIHGILSKISEIQARVDAILNTYTIPLKTDVICISNDTSTVCEEFMSTLHSMTQVYVNNVYSQILYLLRSIQQCITMLDK